jgi:hypothetical protein
VLELIKMSYFTANLVLATTFLKGFLFQFRTVPLLSRLLMSRLGCSLSRGLDLVYSRFLVFEICLEWRSCGWQKRIAYDELMTVFISISSQCDQSKGLVFY